MSATVPNVRADASRPARGGLYPYLVPSLIYAVAALIAVFFALLVRDSTIIGDAYVPRGNDSFYHARRILDAAIGSRGFYQFDERLQAPEGTWIPWPWAYDYLLAKATQLAIWIEPTLDPMTFISYIPVAWILVNAALLLAVTRTIGLSLEMQLLAMLCFALSPLTQLLHSIGMIDHHYVELTFVLLSAWLGLRWFERPDDTRRAVALGTALGLAPAFHNGLFILQLMPLATVFVLWLRCSAPAPAALRAFSVALLAVTQVVLVPSQPYREGMFEFGLLSWFHFYAAACTAVALAFMAWRRSTRANLAWFLALCASLMIPLSTQLADGAGFVSGGISILWQITEVQSPYKLFTEVFGAAGTAGWYSWLLLLAPPLLVYYGIRAFREERPGKLYHAVVATFGLALLLAQFRLHYFGFAFLVTGGLLIVEELRIRRGWHRGVTFVLTFAAIVLAYQPPLRDRLFVVYAPGADTEYAGAFAIFLDLGTLCAANPGVVLASSDDGSAILFHSECSVIANNFILREPDTKHIDEINRLMSLSPAEIRAERPDVKYVFVRVRDFSVVEGDVAGIVNKPIANQLLVDETPPPGYTRIKTIHRRFGEDGEEHIYARLYAVAPIDPPGAP